MNTDSIARHTLPALLAIGCAGLAAAQEPAPRKAAIGAQLEEVIVNAQRRDTNLQRTPIAVSALDSGLISQASPKDIGQLESFVPNFSAAKVTGYNAASFAMRGVGQTNIIVYYEAPVSVLIDDFVAPSVQTQLLDTFDVAQVEVLRGPQGTLFGKNATGGAVVVRTKKPEINAPWSAQAQTLFGSYGTREWKAALNAPLIDDNLALRLVLGKTDSDGYMRNGANYGPTIAGASKFNGIEGSGDGRRLGGEDVFNGRLKLLFTPTASITALLQQEILRDRSDSVPVVNSTPAGDPGYLFNTIGLGASRGDPLDRGGSSLRNGYLLDEGSGQHIDVDGTYANIDFDLGHGTITSVTGYREQYSQIPSSFVGTHPVAADGEVLATFDGNRIDQHDTFQQELRYGSAWEGPLQIVGGVFYQRDDIDFCVAQIVGFQDLFGPSPYGPWNENPYILCSNQKTTSRAAFGEANYDLSDQLTLTLGLRYTAERKTWQGRQQTFVQDLAGSSDPSFTWRELGGLRHAGDFDRFPAGVITDRERWSELTYRAGLDYVASDDLFFYGSYSRGFKAGGYNDQIGSFAIFGSDLDAFKAAAAPTDPEIADSFEAGMKSEYFDKRLRLNLTGFYVKYSDMQRQIIYPTASFQVTRFINAASATVKGIEAELVAAPTERLTLRAIASYQKGEYDDFDAPSAGYDLSTQPLDRTPEWQAGFDSTYRREIFGMVVSANLNIAYTDENLYTLSSVSPSNNRYLDARTLVNGSLTFATADENYYVRLLGRNLTDERYLTGDTDVASLWSFATYGPPRFYGIELGAKIR